MKKTVTLNLCAVLIALSAHGAQAGGYQNAVLTNSSSDYCREYTKDVVIGGRMQQSYGTACMQPDRSWEIQNQDQADKGEVIPVDSFYYSYNSPAPVYSPPPTYYAPGYYVPPQVYYPPVVRPAPSISLGFIFSDHDRGGRHGGWRGHNRGWDRGGWDRGGWRDHGGGRGHGRGHGHGGHGHGGWR